MPLEISEIGVFVAIGDPAAAVPPPHDHAADAEAMTPERIEALVRACVHDVLRTLRMREER